MRITEKDYKIMRDLLDKGLDAVLNEATPSTIGNNECFVFPLGIYLGCNKSMALDIYKFAKPRKVYFQNADGLWLLDQKGDVALCK